MSFADYKTKYQRRLCMHVTSLHSLCGRGHQAFVTEAVLLGELLHEEALFGLTGSERFWEYPEDAFSHLDFASPPYLSSLGMARPFTNKVEMGWKNVQTLWWAELDRLHSMTRAHPPLTKYFAGV